METTTGLVTASESTTEPVLLKTDVLGRVKHTVEQREKLLNEFERSEVSGAHFAALAGVKYQTFATWVQVRLQLSREPRPGPQMRLNCDALFTLYRMNSPSQLWQQVCQ